MLPVWDDGRMIVEDGHIALKAEMKFATRRYRAPYGLEQVEMRQEGKELDAAGPLYVALTEYKKPGPTTLSPLKQKTVNKIIDCVRGDKVETSKIIKSTNILNARAGGGKSWKGWMETKKSNR